MLRVWEGNFGSVFGLGIFVWVDLLDRVRVMWSNLVEGWRV